MLRFQISGFYSLRSKTEACILFRVLCMQMAVTEHAENDQWGDLISVLDGLIVSDFKFDALLTLSHFGHRASNSVKVMEKL